MKILLYAGCCVRDELKRDMTQLWARVMRRLNPDCDMLLFDTASDIRPETFIEPGILIRRFNDNPGHLSHGGGDGAGRTFFAGIEHAITAGYDYAITCETDLLFVRPIADVVRRMEASRVNVACLQMPYYQFFEWGFAAINVAWARDTEWEKRYDWRQKNPGTIPEWRMEWSCGNDLFVLPYRGIRNSGQWVNAQTIAGMFPYAPPDWLHENAATDLTVMREFLRINGIAVS